MIHVFTVKLSAPSSRKVGGKWNHYHTVSEETTCWSESRPNDRGSPRMLGMQKIGGVQLQANMWSPELVQQAMW